MCMYNRVEPLIKDTLRKGPISHIKDTWQNVSKVAIPICNNTFLNLWEEDIPSTMDTMVGPKVSKVPLCVVLASLHIRTCSSISKQGVQPLPKRPTLQVTFERRHKDAVVPIFLLQLRPRPRLVRTLHRRAACSGVEKLTHVCNWVCNSILRR